MAFTIKQTRASMTCYLFTQGEIKMKKLQLASSPSYTDQQKHLLAKIDGKLSCYCQCFDW